MNRCSPMLVIATGLIQWILHKVCFCILPFVIFLMTPNLSAEEIGSTTSALIGGERDVDNAITNSVVYLPDTGGCTGTLIAPRIVVTAGHCITHNPPVRGLPPTNEGGKDWELPGVWYPLFDYPNGVRVQFGNDRNNPRLTVRAFHYNHPGWADVVMLGLDEAVPAETAVPAPVLTSLPSNKQPADFWKGESFEMVGWGFTDSCQGSNPARFRQRAKATYGAYPHNERPNQLRVEGKKNASVAQGDSGGPLFWTWQDRRFLVGTVQGCERNGGRYFGTWTKGGKDENGKQRPNLSAWYDSVLTPGVDWSLLDDSPYGIKDVAVCNNGRLQALGRGGALLENSALGQSTWRVAGRLHVDAKKIACAANQTYFQRENREIRRLSGRPSRTTRVGFPPAAANISGSEDSTLDFPFMWALNDNKTLWLNTAGGLDGKWQRVGRPWAAKDIAATQRGIFAVNDDNSLWWNTREGADGEWLRIGEMPSPSRDLAASSLDQTDQIVLLALTDSSNLMLGDFMLAGGAIPERVLNGEVRAFELPEYGDSRLDWCFTWGNDCGEKAANAFCRLRGYTSATAFSIDRDIGATSPTMTVGDLGVCSDRSCDGFKRISCQR